MQTVLAISLNKLYWRKYVGPIHIISSCAQCLTDENDTEGTIPETTDHPGCTDWTDDNM
jgi:hypothetical protein